MKPFKAVLLAAVLSALALSGCGNGSSANSSGSSGSGSSASLNPFHWFGRAKSRKATSALPAKAADSRLLVDQVATLRVEKTPGGAIIRATGLPPTQGYWDGALVPENGEKPVKGVLTYRFVIAQPVGYQAVSTPRSREVVIARALSRIKLEGVRQIRVIGQRNQLTSRR